MQKLLDGPGSARGAAGEHGGAGRAPGGLSPQSNLVLQSLGLPYRYAYGNPEPRNSGAPLLDSRDSSPGHSRGVWDTVQGLEGRWDPSSGHLVASGIHGFLVRCSSFVGTRPGPFLQHASAKWFTPSLTPRGTASPSSAAPLPPACLLGSASATHFSVLGLLLPGCGVLAPTGHGPACPLPACRPGLAFWALAMAPHGDMWPHMVTSQGCQGPSCPGSRWACASGRVAGWGTLLTGPPH